MSADQTNTPQTREQLLARVSTNRGVCGGMACVTGTRIPIAIILDSLAIGMSEAEIMRSYPSLQPLDIRAAIAYAAELARESVWRLAAG